MNPTQHAVLAAAQQLVDAFARHDTVAYFEAFAPEASFVFHTHGAVLPNRAAYQALWAGWERELGFRVRSCSSHDQMVQMLGETAAVFHHRVHTVLGSNDGDVVLDERETIVFHLGANGRWLAVHEHLSALPTAQQAAA